MLFIVDAQNGLLECAGVPPLALSLDPNRYPVSVVVRTFDIVQQNLSQAAAYAILGNRSDLFSFSGVASLSVRNLLFENTPNALYI